MPSFELTSPDGKKYIINGPEGSTPEQAFQILQSQLGTIKPETPSIGSQLLSAPKEFIKSAASGVVQSIGGLGALPYAGARYISPELPPFEQTGFGKAITGAEQYLAPSDEGVITQVVGGLGSVASLLGPQVALRGLGAAGRFAGVAPRAAMPVGVAQTAGLGAEEARQRVEIARGDKIDVTPGQELEALAIGVPIGLTELLPVEKLFRGLDKTLSGDVKLTIYNHIKRGLAQGGIEAAQEAASGLMQDLSAKGIYDSNIDVGSSMLHDAMLGGGVGFLAQTGLDLLLRKDIGRAYQAKLANDKQRELNKKIDAYQQEIDKQTIQKNKNLNVSDPNLLSLPPPSPEVEHQGKPDPLMNPLGFFKEGELSPEYLKAVNDIRKKQGKQSISQFSIEDLADAGAPQQEVDRLLAAKTGYTGETQLSSDDVLNVASKKNIDTSTVGFLDFLRRTTGAENLNKMSQPQLFSAFKALDALAPSDRLQVLPPGTNSTRFSTEQYDKAIEKLTSVFPEDNMMSRHEIIKNIKKIAGLKNNRDAESILQTAILKDDLTTVNREVYETGKKGDMTSPAINVYTNREEAEREAARRDLDIRERTHQYIALPGKATQLPGGPDIRKGTFEKGVEPSEYEIRFPDGIKLTAPSIEEANAKADRVQAIRTKKSGDLLKQISKKQQSMKKDQFDLENMESEGKSDTLEYKKKSAEVSVKTKKLQDEIDNLKAQVQFLTDSPNISPKGQKPITENGFTLFEQNKPISTFQTQEAAEEFAIMRLPDNILQDIVNLAPEQKGLMPKRLGVLANKEIARRSGKGPSGLGIEYTGKKEDVEKRLAEIGIFTPQFQKQVNELDKKLRPIMNRLGLGDLRLNIVRAIKTPEGQEANGSYVRGLIEIALNADNPMRALRHESIHALKELGAFTKDQWRVLENKAKSEWMSKYDIQNRYSGLSMDEMIEEAIADAFSDFSTTKAPPGLIGALFNKIEKFFDAMGNALRGMGFHTAESIFSKVEAGELELTKEPTAGKVKYATAQPEQPLPTSLKSNPFKATEKDNEQAKDYFEDNGIYPYLSESPVQIPTEPVSKYSIKTADKYGFDGATGLPLNKDGTVTLYYPTTAENLKVLNTSKLLKAENGQNGVYLTNDSSGWKVMGKMGNMPQKTDGSVALLNVDPSLIQIDNEYEDGRKDFYIPTSEGEFFNKKMRMGAMYADRNRAIDPSFTYDKLTKAFDTLAEYNRLPIAEQKEALKAAKAILKSQHNITTLLAENGKLEKTRVGDYGLTTYDGKSVASLGLGLASAQRLNEKTTTCPNSAICEALCLGDTSGGNRLYGGMAAEDIFTPEGVKVSKTSFRAGPRLSQYLKTEAMIINPEAFAIVLDNEIKKFSAWAAKTTHRVHNPETNKVEMVSKEVYAPSIRFNVTSDFPPKVFKGLMDANPDVIFYDYTKLNSDTVAPNHHLTYSSTGFSQIVNGQPVLNKEQNWRQMMRRLSQGHNVAMAFSSKSALPKKLIDEETGKQFEIWDGDNYDARFLDPKTENGEGMIVGLKNKAGDLTEKNATAETDGFFVNYNPKDGDTVVVPTQSKLLSKKPEFSLKQTNTPRYSIKEQLGQDTVDAIDRTTKKREVKGFSDRISEAMSPTSFTKFRQGYINKYESIEKLSHAVSKVFGSKELMADTSAIAAALLSDRAAGVAASSYKNGIPVYRKGFTTVSNENGEVKGLIPILEPLMELNDPFAFQAFQFYAATRRGRRLDQEQRENLFTEDDLRRGETVGKMFPVFKTVFDEYQKYNKGLVDFMRDTGVISEKEAEIWTENWDYIPFYRQMDGEKTLGPNIFSSIAGVSKPKKLKGGEAPLDDFMETIIRNSRAAIESGMKNVAAQRVMRDVLRMNQGELVKPSQAVGDDIVTVKENGVTKHYRVDDPLLVESLKGLNLPQLPFLEILSKPAEVLRNLVTKDPGFMMANLMRDSIQSWVTSGTDMKPLVDTFKQYASTLANRSPEAQALANAGLFAGYDFGSDTKSSARAVEAALRKRTGKLTTKEKAILPLTKIWDMLDQGSAASDVATRAEIYKRTLAETGNEAEALYQAMEVLNFSRKGNSALIRVLSAMVPFMNARIQGLDMLYRSGFGKMATQNKERMQKAFISRSMTLFALSWMYWMLASDTDEYKTAEQETRDNNWIIGNVRIPIPFEIGTVFKVMPERILEYFLGSDTSKDLKESIVRNITSTLAFNPIPQAFLPVVENMANYSFFTGKPIVGRGMEDVAKPYQVAPSTSLLAKKISEITEPFLYDKLQQSPIQIDHLIRGYTGTLGTYAVMALDSIFRGEGSPTRATLKAEQMPVVKRFFASEEGTGTVSAYYELKKNVDESVRTINFLERTGNIDDLREYMKEKGIKLQAIKPYIQTLDKEMTRLHDMKRMIQSSNMNPDDKRDVLSKIHTAEVKLTSGIQRIKNFID